MASFKWKLKSLPFDSEQINYHLDSDFFNEIESTEISAACIDARVEMTRKSDSRYELSIACTGEVTIPCDRCLADMTHKVDATYRLSVNQEGDMLDDSNDGVLIIPESWHELDVAPLIRDTVLLNIPLMHAHAPGECDPDMMERLKQLETSDEEPASQDVDPRWDALRKLKEEQ